MSHTVGLRFTKQLNHSHMIVHVVISLVACYEGA